MKVIETKIIHTGQYKPYGDSFYEFDIKTPETDIEKVKQYCVDTYNYGVNLPTEEEFKANKNKSFDVFFYFNGYHTLTPITGGFKFIMCKPYTD